MARSVLICALMMFGALLAHATPASATGGEGETWPTFTESSSCGADRMSTPHNSYSGWLNRETVLRGEFAAMYGRTVQQVLDDLVRWTIPGSTEVLAVHPNLIPALERAAANLEAAFDAGELYRIHAPSTYSAAARTISGSLRVSQHTFGAAFDVNARTNPYRGDNKLVTDLPDWWVDAFLDAGFCWGGLWIGAKDSMHFTWQGPAFGGYDALPASYEPLTEPVPFGSRDAAVAVVPRARLETITTVLADGNSNGATDVIRLSPLGDDLAVEVSTSSRRHNACSTSVGVASGLAGAATAAHTIGFGDWDGRGGQDLWLAIPEDDVLRLTVRWAFGDYSAETSVITDVPVPSRDAWVSSADVDIDGDLDLFIVDSGTLTVWDVDPDTGATELLLEAVTPFDDLDELFLGDFDLDQRPDLWAVDAGSVSIATAAGAFAEISELQHPAGLPRSVVDASAADYDGDGRADLVVFDGTTKFVWLGNTPLPDGKPAEIWFEYDPEDIPCGEFEQRWFERDLRYRSGSWIAEGSYEWRRRADLPVGCNPEKDDCPPTPVTRQMVAEFFAWIDGLDAAPGSEVVAAARALGWAGYQLPCSARDEACWLELMPVDEISTYFGQFLADRRGDAHDPHRWIIPPSADPPTTTFPSIS